MIEPTTFVMVALILLAGGLAGVTANWAADYLPRFANQPPADLPRPVWRLAIPHWPPRRHHADHVALVAQMTLLVGYVALWLISDDPLAFVGLALCLTYFLLVAIIDLKYRLVLDVMTIPAMIVAVVGHALLPQGDLPAAIVGGGFTFGIFMATAYLRPNDIGGGDIKLAAAMGLLLGFPAVLWGLLVGAGLGAVVLSWHALRQRGCRITIAYAPYLSLGAMIALLFNPFVQ